MRSRSGSEDTADIALVQRVLAGEKNARVQVNAIAHPIIEYQSDRFCKRFCADNKYIYKCTLAKPWGAASTDALLCEWGNASYGWMLEELASDKRLSRYKGYGGAGLYEYMFSVANSLPFYERWKDWRFGRRSYAPSYIRQLDDNAAKVFFSIKDGHAIEVIAQQLGMDEAQVDALAQEIVVTLTQRGKLHLLENERTISLDRQSESDGETDAKGQVDIESNDPDPEFLENTRLVKQAWGQLSPVEQYVLEAMLIEEQDANDVLYALKEMDISLNEKKPGAEIDRQQLYYFRRKTLAKLSRLVGLH